MYYVNILQNTFNISPTGEVLEGFIEITKEKFDELYMGKGEGKVILPDLSLTTIKPSDIHLWDNVNKEWYLPDGITMEDLKMSDDELLLSELLPLSPLRIKILFLELGKNLKEILDDMSSSENIKIIVTFDEKKVISFKDEVITLLINKFKLKENKVIEKWKDIQNRKF